MSEKRLRALAGESQSEWSCGVRRMTLTGMSHHAPPDLVRQRRLVHRRPRCSARIHASAMTLSGANEVLMTHFPVGWR